MTDHAKNLERIAHEWHKYKQPEHTQLYDAATELRRLQKLVDDCAGYLEDGDTPADALNRLDLDYANLWHSINVVPGSEIAKLKNDREQLAALARFGKWCFDAHRENFTDLEGGDIQEAAEKFNLIHAIEVAEPCCEDCQCAEHGDWPSHCYRTTPLAQLPNGIE